MLLDARTRGGVMTAKYDSIGINYAELRKPDRRIAKIIESALGSAQTVLNVGAGTGSYEPADRSLIAVEPSRRPWLTDYLPGLAALDERQMPTMSDYERWLGSVQITPVLVPHDCSDGFLYAYWRRPAAYLEARIRSGSSSFWAISNAEAGLQKLRRDLETGEWERRYAEL